MDANYRRCIRCRGRKKIYKVRGAYSYTNTGGVEVDCPMCLGEGMIRKLEVSLPDSFVDACAPESKESMREIQKAPKVGKISRAKTKQKVASVALSKDLTDDKHEEIERA